MRAVRSTVVIVVDVVGASCSVDVMGNAGTVGVDDTTAVCVTDMIGNVGAVGVDETVVAGTVGIVVTGMASIDKTACQWWTGQV